MDNSEFLLLQPTEAVGLAQVLWEIAADPLCEHDRMVSALGDAGLLELRAGLPPSPTHPEATAKVIEYFQSLKGCIESFSQSRHNVTSTIGAHAEIRLRFPWNMVSLLWDAVSDPATKPETASRAAFYACLLERLIRGQLHYDPDAGDLEEYARLQEYFDQQIAGLNRLIERQRKNQSAPRQPTLTVQANQWLVETVSGADKLIEWFGEWPSFHDAEVVEVRLFRNGRSFVHIHVWKITDKVDDKGLFVTDKHAVVTFSIEEIIAVELSDFSHQNVISGLSLEATQDGIKLELEPCYGLSGSIVAKRIRLHFLPGKPSH